MIDIPRDPQFYRPTIHASQQRRDRGIEWGAVADAIKTGSLERSMIDPTEIIVRGENASCVVNPESGDIVTVVEGEYRYEKTKTARYG